MAVFPGRRQADQIDVRIRAVQTERENLAAAIANRGGLDILLEHLGRADATLKELMKQRKRASATSSGQPAAATVEDVERNFPEVLDYLMENSCEFASLLRRVIQVFRMMPLQAVDTGKPVARALVTFSFSAMTESRPAESYQPQPGDFSVSLDLFDPRAHNRRR